MRVDLVLVRHMAKRIENLSGGAPIFLGGCLSFFRSTGGPGGPWWSGLPGWSGWSW